jgi:hypothetical protein
LIADAERLEEFDLLKELDFDDEFELDPLSLVVSLLDPVELLVPVMVPVLVALLFPLFDDELVPLLLALLDPDSDPLLDPEFDPELDPLVLPLFDPELEFDSEPEFVLLSVRQSASFVVLWFLMSTA